MPFAYVLSPYTHEDFEIMNYRAHLTACGIAHLMSKPEFEDYIFFSPVVHYHQVALRNEALPRDVGYWWKINLSFMRQATHAVVFQIPGWKESKGIKKELQWFANNREPSNYPAEIIYFNTDWEKF